jgi:manganese-dependent inorganic pyrophosphatase
VEIIDHHRLSSLPTDTPIPIDIQPVGSTSTLVAERTRADGVALPPGVAGVLLCGILSDTLVFRSPTTTARDRAVARWLGEAAGLYTENISPDEAIAALGEALLGAGAELGGRSADDIVRADLKLYEVGRLRVGVAQTEVTGFAALDARHTDLGIALERLRETDHLALALLVVTDVLRGDSRILAAGEPRLIAALPYRHRDDNTLDAPGVVSRKKQILPALLAALAAFA